MSNALKLIVSLLILTACAAQARNFTGQVEHVHDGDTLTVNGVKVRLYGIDAPELSQPGGEASREHLRALVSGRRVKVLIEDTDVYGRTVGRVFLPDGSDVCAEMVRSGQAWVYRKYCQDCYGLYAAEALARWRGIGLWGQNAPMPPWQWRKLHRRSAFGIEKLVCLQDALAQRRRPGADRPAGHHRPGRA